MGDSVKFAATGFHTADFPAKGQNPLPFILPIGQSVSGASDAAGQPFWFNGQPIIGFNPALGKSFFGKKVTYTGSKRAASGIPAGNGPPKPFTVKFTKAGSYTYYCNIHAGMKGTVRVVSHSRPVPSAKADKAAVKRQVSAALKSAKTLSKKIVPAGTVSVGAADAHGVEYYGMVPAAITVNAGTTLAFRMAKGSTEDHTATFGPGNPMDDKTPSYLGDLAKSFQGNEPPNPIGVYPSESPGTPASLSPALHGNGFWNSGVMDTTKATPLPASNSVRFDTPGTYTYYCLIHPFMKGTVTVK